MQLPQDIHAWLEARRTMNSHRQLLVISGSQDWVKNNLATFLAHEHQKSKLHLSSDSKSADITNQNYKKALGQEYHYVVYDAFGGIRANALFALSGCVSRAGLMIILCPSYSSWPTLIDPQRRLRTSYGYESDNHPSNFINRLIQLLEHGSYTCTWTEGGFSGKFAPCPIAPDTKTATFCKTQEQQHAVDSLIANLQKTKSQTVITANRGRGKSAALGIAAAKIIHGSELMVAVTAAHKSMTAEIFHQTKRVLKQISPSRAAELYENLQFVAFDKLLEETNQSHVLLIDEAAVIPNSVLKQLVAKFRHVVFTTTVHGYEGSGRGFELRFKPFLIKHYPSCLQITMEEPIRWQKGDVLESFWFDAMAMSHFSTTKNTNSQVTINTTKTFIRQLSASSLVDDSPLLTDIFQLLIDAHYQTSPDDLLRLLDANDQWVHVILNENNQALAVAICNTEGGERLNDVASGIADGRRRVPGHLTAQRLAFEYAEPAYSAREFYRVVRIAVRSEMRGRGLGTQLISHLRAYASAKNYHYLSTSYGLTVELLAFWHKSDFHMVKIGLKKDASSGEFSVLMLSLLTENLVLNCEYTKLRTLGADQFHFSRHTRFKQLPDKITKQLLTDFDGGVLRNSNKALLMRVSKQFINGQRPLYTSAWALSGIFNLTLETNKKAQHEFLYDLLVEQKPNRELVVKYGLSGKKQIESYARKKSGIFVERHF